MSLTDAYNSRFLAAARETRNIKKIKNIDCSNIVIVEMMDGSEQQLQWDEVFKNYNAVEPMNKI